VRGVSRVRSARRERMRMCVEASVSSPFGIRPSAFLDTWCILKGSELRIWGVGVEARVRSPFGTKIGNKYFTEMCSGFEAGSYLRLIDFVYHSTLGLTETKKEKKKKVEGFGTPWRAGLICPKP